MILTAWFWPSPYDGWLLPSDRVTSVEASVAGMDGTEERARRASSFGAAAADYDRFRPGYPTAALDRLLGPDVRRVLDVGAGTGALTRALVARGLDVVAVEPDPGMRAVLGARSPSVDLRAGRAEALPLPDADVDAVLAGQAWHWVDPELAGPEVARVLRPGGVLCLLWNLRDVSVPWVKALGEAYGSEDAAGQAVPTSLPVGPAAGEFGPMEVVEVAWAQPQTPEGLVELAATRSNVLVLGPAEREATLDRVRALTRTDPALAGREELELPYVTGCLRAVRR